MTIKQIAEATGKAERTVQRWVKRLSDRMASINAKMASSSPMNPADFDLPETLEIIEAGMGKNARLIYEKNASGGADKEQALTIESRLDLLEKAMVGVISTMEVMARGFELMAKDRANSTAALPSKKPERPRIEFNPRIEINKRVRDYAIEKRVAYAVVWNSLYRELSYQLHTDLRERASELGMNMIDYIESIGEMPALLEVCDFMLK